MTATAITMVCLGLLIIVGRGPLIFAPDKTRDTYLRWLASDTILRVYGIVIGVLAMVVIYTTQKDVGAAAQIMHGFAWFIAVMCAVVLIPFPGPVARMGTAIWGRFSPPVLRAMGALSVAVGGWLVWYGLTV